MNEDWKESHSDRIVLLKVNICLRKILGIIGLQSVDTGHLKKNAAQCIVTTPTTTQHNFNTLVGLEMKMIMKSTVTQR